MFLNELNSQEAEAFINLVKDLAAMDEIFAKEEESLIEDYIDELLLKGKEIKRTSLKETRESLKLSSDRIKKIIYFELTGLALADGEFESKEENFLKDMAHEFNISASKVRGFLDYFKNVKSIYDFTTVDYESKISLLKEEAEALLQ